MKFKKKSVCLLLLIVMLFALCPTALAFSIDPTKTASLTVDFGYGDEKLAGAKFDLFYIASFDDKVDFVLTDEFAEYPVRVSDNTIDGWNELAVVLKGFALADNHKPAASITTDENGIAQLNDLTPGLYLVVGSELVKGEYVYSVAPTIVCLPGLNQTGDNTYEWNYDVEIQPKSVRDEKPEDENTGFEVIKRWIDKGHESKRPSEITVQLICKTADGKVDKKQVTINKDNKWKYTWDDLPTYTDDGQLIEWLAIESEVPEGYSVNVEKHDNQFVIINTYSGTEAPDTPASPDTPEKLPQTGLLWWPVPVLLSAGLLLIIIGILRREKSN